MSVRSIASHLLVMSAARAAASRLWRSSRTARSKRAAAIEPLEQRQLLSLSAAEVRYDWTHPTPQFLAELRQSTKTDPPFITQVAADLAPYGISLSDVLAGTAVPAPLPTAGQASTATATKTAPSALRRTAPQPAVTSQGINPQSVRNNYGGWVGFEFTTQNSALSVSQLGRWVVAGNSQTHAIKLVDQATNQDVPGGSVTVNTSGAASGRYLYGNLPAAVTLLAHHSYYLLSQEVNGNVTYGADQWYDTNTSVTPSADITVPQSEYSDGSGYYQGAPGSFSYGPVNFMYTPLAAGQPAVVNQVPGGLRNNYGGWVGFEFTTKSTPLVVTQLGRWVLQGNSQSHALKLVDQATNQDVPGASVTVNTSGAASDQYLYGSLASPVTLAANHSYYLLSQEVNGNVTYGADQWYDTNTNVTPSADITLPQSEFGDNGSYYAGATPNLNGPVSYGPVNFLYTGSAAASSGVYNYSVNPHTLTFNFQEPMYAANWAAAVTVIDLNTGSPVSVTTTAAGSVSSVTYTLGSQYLADGNYVAVLHGSQVTDSSGNPLTGSDGIAGHDYFFDTTATVSSDFWFLSGDFDRDRSVGNSDYSILQSNYNGTGKTYSQGDLNYDGKVDIYDFTTFTQQSGKTVQALGTPAELTPLNTGSNSIELSWAAADDSRVTSYDVYRNWQRVATGVTGTTFTDAGLTPSTSYAYTVVARDGAGDSSYPSDELVTSTAASGYVPTITLSGAASVAAGAQYTLGLSASYPAGDPNPGPIQSWTVNFGDGEDIQTFAGSTTSIPYIFPRGIQSSTILVTATDQYGTYYASPLTVSIISPVPNFAQQPSASPSPVTGTTSTLTASASDAAGGQLVYNWSVTSKPDGADAPLFQDNNDSTAASTTVTFSAAGSYTLEVTAVNPEGVSATSTVSVTVQQTQTSVSVTPGYAAVAPGQTQQLSATASDQFGNPMSTQPSFTWSVASGLGTVSSAGLYTAATDGGPLITVSAAANGGSGTASLVVNKSAIDFNNLAVGTVVTNQYPGVTFSADSGKDNEIQTGNYGTSGNQLGTAPANPYPQNWNNNLYVDFAVPVDNLTFKAVADDDTGVIAHVRVFVSGTYSATVDLTGDGNVSTPQTVDLSVYQNVTRIELTGITDTAGLWWDDFSFTAVQPTITAHRTGLNAGQQISDSVKQSDDPTQYLVLVDDDIQADPSSGMPDNQLSTADVLRDDYVRDDSNNPVDPDLAKITLKKLPMALNGGEVDLVLSDPSAVRLFQSDGTLLYQHGLTPSSDITLNLSSPSGYLSGLTSGDVDVWLQGMHADKDFTFALVFKDADGQTVAEDHVHMDIADWTFRGTDGKQIGAVAPLWKDALMAAATDPSGIWQEGIDVGNQPSDSFFRSEIRGLPSSAGAQIQVTSETRSSDTFADSLAYSGPSGSEAASQDFAALYNGNQYLSSDDTSLGSSDEALIRSNLMLNVVHNDGASVKLTTAQDQEQRELQKSLPVQFTGLSSDVVTPGAVVSGTAAVNDPNAQGYVVKVDLYRNGELFEGGSSPAQATEPFNFTLKEPGIYQLRAIGWRHTEIGKFSPWASGVFAVDVDATVANSPYRKAAWEALQIGNVSGSQPVDPGERNRRITELYVNMYNANKDPRGGDHYFKWAGAAAFVSKGVGDSLALAANGGLAALGAELLGFDKLPIVGNTENLRQTLGKSYNLLGDGNFGIYMDIYPTFLAYTDANGAGVNNISNMKPAVGPELLDAWKLVDAAIHSNPVNDAQLWQGMQQIADYEQRRVLQPKIFDPNRPFWTSFTNNYGSRIVSPIPGASSFPQVVPMGDFGSADNRLQWFNTDLLPKFKTWVTKNPGDIDVATLLSGGYH